VKGDRRPPERQSPLANQQAAIGDIWHAVCTRGNARCHGYELFKPSPTNKSAPEQRPLAFVSGGIIAAVRHRFRPVLGLCRGWIHLSNLGRSPWRLDELKRLIRAADFQHQQERWRERRLRELLQQRPKYPRGPFWPFSRIREPNQVYTFRLYPVSAGSATQKRVRLPIHLPGMQAGGCSSA
jgi:hypothetical protein